MYKLTRNLFEHYTLPENRITHAFITFLEVCSIFHRSLLDDFFNLISVEGISSKVSIEFELQKNPFTVENVEKESELDEHVIQGKEKEMRKTIPDAWITCSTEDKDYLVILIENKISENQLYKEQLLGHLHYLKGLPHETKVLLLVTPDKVSPEVLKDEKLVGIADMHHTRIKLLSWLEIRDWLTKLSVSENIPKCVQLFLFQFTVYLKMEVEVLQEFEGFALDDFEFFIGRDSLKRSRLKRKMELLQESIKEHLESKYPQLFQKLIKTHLSPLQSSDSHSWMVFSHKEDYKYFAHYTIATFPNILSVWLNAETLSATNRAIKNIKKNTVEFFELLDALDGYGIKLSEHIKTEGESFRRKWPLKFIFEIQADYLDSSTRQMILEKLNRPETFPILEISKKLYLTKEEDRALLTSIDLVETIVKIMKELEPLFDFINR